MKKSLKGKCVTPDSISPVPRTQRVLCSSFRCLEDIQETMLNLQIAVMGTETLLGLLTSMKEVLEHITPPSSTSGCPRKHADGANGKTARASAAGRGKATSRKRKAT